MRALTYHGLRDVRLDEKPDPRIQEPRDAVIAVTSTAICGSDLHLYHGLVPGLEEGEILGHEAIGVVEEVGDEVGNLREGDRVVVPFPIAEGHCVNCRRGLYAQCLETNPGNGAAIFGYSHRYGGVPGGQAELLRVPYADVGPRKLPDGVSDDAGVLLADVLPTGYQAVAQAGVGQAPFPVGDPRAQGAGGEDAPEDATVAVYGCGPVGLMATLSAKRLLGARTVVAVDRIPERLEMARRLGADVTVDFEDDDPVERVRRETDGLGADVTVDAVGFEASSPRRIASAVEKAAGAVLLQTGSLTALRWAVDSVRHGGTVSVPGVYAAAPAQMFPWGPLWEKGVRLLMGQTHVQAHLPLLLDAVADGAIDPAQIVTHHAGLEEGPDMYRLFEKKEDACVKVVLNP